MGKVCEGHGFLFSFGAMSQKGPHATASSTMSQATLFLFGCGGDERPGVGMLGTQDAQPLSRCGWSDVKHLQQKGKVLGTGFSVQVCTFRAGRSSGGRVHVNFTPTVLESSPPH